MGRDESKSSMARRSFLGRLGAGAGVVGAAVIGSAGVAQAAAETGWQPAREAQDAWFDQIPGRHRLVFDTTNPEGIEMGLRYANNYFKTNQKAYGLKDSDLAVVIVVRHKSTSFGYNDAMWAKYGKQFSQQSGFVDPKTKEPPKVNVFAAGGGEKGQPGLIDALVHRGAHFGVCSVATHAMAGRIARATGGKMEAILHELTTNLVGNGRMVPAGIVAVNRAQEHGYTYVYSA